MELERYMGTRVRPDSAGMRLDLSAPVAMAYRAFLKLQAATGGGAMTASGATARDRGGGDGGGGGGGGEDLAAAGGVDRSALSLSHCTVVHVAGSGGGGGGGGGSPGIAHYAVAARRQTLALRGRV